MFIGIRYEGGTRRSGVAPRIRRVFQQAPRAQASGSAQAPRKADAMVDFVVETGMGAAMGVRQLDSAVRPHNPSRGLGGGRVSDRNTAASGRTRLRESPNSSQTMSNLRVGSSRRAIHRAQDSTRGLCPSSAGSRSLGLVGAA